MSVGKRIKEALQRYGEKDYEAALIPTSIAIDETSKRFYRKNKNKSERGTYKQFIRENLKLITRISIGTQVERISLGYHHPMIKASANGTCAIEEIFYHAVRCGLLHESCLPDNLEFRPGCTFNANDKNNLVLPSELILGLILATVVCPANMSERVPDNCMIFVNGFAYPVNRFWGREERLIGLLPSICKPRTPPPTPS